MKNNSPAAEFHYGDKCISSRHQNTARAPQKIFSPKTIKPHEYKLHFIIYVLYLKFLLLKNIKYIKKNNRT